MDARIVAAGLLGLGALIVYSRSRSEAAAPSVPYGGIVTYPSQTQIWTETPSSGFDFSSITNLFGDLFNTSAAPQQTIPTEQPYTSDNPFFDVADDNAPYVAPPSTADNTLPDWITQWGEPSYTPPTTETPATQESLPSWITGWGEPAMPISADQAGRNVAAFLAMIKYSEGVEPNPYGQDPYRITYGYRHIIQNMSDHPSNTGEWNGVQTQWGLTTASGAYQFLKSTWNDMNIRWGFLDFSPASQDLRATQRMQDRGALDLVKAGNFQAALDKLGAEWASLPTSTSGQPQRSFDQVSAIYQNAGGAFA